MFTDVNVYICLHIWSRCIHESHSIAHNSPAQKLLFHFQSSYNSDTGSKASKKAGRIAAEGVAIAMVDGNQVQHCIILGKLL